MKGYSNKCPDLSTFWQETRCVPCQIKPGHVVTPNCGFDDDGGRHVPPFRECSPGTFNDGSRAECRLCSSCGPDSFPARNCTTSADTKCLLLSSGTTVSHMTIIAYMQKDINLTPESNKDISAAVWLVPLSVVIVILLALSAVLLKKHKRGVGWYVFRLGHRGRLCYKRGSMYQHQDFSSGSSSAGQSDVEEILNDVLSAPVQTVLDDLDVLEELVILLDPETQGRKNTKHLASHCSFPSTWVTYTYSMRESKSPLKAVLEGVSSRHPDWTVGHLAKFLKQMDRNDAIAVLAKLKPCTHVQNYV